MSITDFADHGIAGLTTRDTVRRYRTLWIKYGDSDIKPGDTVILPDLDFPPEEANLGSRLTESSLAKAIAEKPEMAQAAAEALASDKATAKTAVTAVAKAVPDAITEAMDDDKEVDTAVSHATLHTKSYRTFTKDTERRSKEMDARKSEAPKVLTAQLALDTMWGAATFFSTMEEAERTDEALYVAGHMADWFRRAAVRVDAWVEGVTAPLTDEDFEAGIKELIGE